MRQGGRKRSGRAPEISELERKADRPRWRDLAERSLKAAETCAGDPELGRLGSQAAGWRWPAPLPEGVIVCALAGEAHAYGRQSHDLVRAALAPQLKRSAEIVLELLDAVERKAAAPTAEAASPAWTRRADIGDGGEP